MVSFLRSATCRLLLAQLVWITAISAGASARQSIEEPSPFDEKAAIAYSQSAIGRSIGDLKFVNRRKKTVSLDQFLGKPLIINMIYTSCYETCPTIVDSLYDGVKIAQDALGKDRFSVITIGFDVRADTPERMRMFAATRGIILPNWHFLSGTEENIKKITETLGFIYFPSPAGFDHLTQTSIIDEKGKVYAHVYGASFSPPSMIEPLKELVFGREKSVISLEGLANRVRLFCTIYDPRNDRYYFDYSIFVGLFIGLLILSTMAYLLLRNAWRLWGREIAAKLFIKNKSNLS